MDKNLHAILAIAIMAIISYLLRALPFLIY